MTFLFQIPFHTEALVDDWKNSMSHEWQRGRSIFNVGLDFRFCHPFINVHVYTVHFTCLLTGININFPNSKVHGANIWGRQDPGGHHIGPMNFASWVNKHWILPDSYRLQLSGSRLYNVGFIGPISAQQCLHNKRCYLCSIPSWTSSSCFFLHVIFPSTSCWIQPLNCDPIVTYHV